MQTLIQPTDVVAMVDRWAQPDARAVIFMDTPARRVTYGELTEWVTKLAGVFSRAGLREGDRIVVSIADEIETSVAFLALVRCGLTAIMLDPAVKPDRARAILQTALPVGYFVDDTFFERVGIEPATAFVLNVKPEAPAKGGLFRKLLGRPADAAPADTYPALLAQVAPAPLPDRISPNTVAYVLFTSGTTSDMKGVQITQRALFAHLHTLNTVYGLDESARLLNILMLYHVDGIVQGPTLAAYNRATCVRPLQFDISLIGTLLDAVYKYRISHFVAVPAMLALIQRFSDGYEDAFRTPDFRFVISVSSYLEDALWRSFSERFGVQVTNVYGLTETVTGGLFCGPSADTFRIGTVGKPVDMEARIVDEAGRDVADGDEGELLLRGDNMMAGYLNNPAATAAVMSGDYLHTGDMARRDADGFYRITGRKKNIVISGGVNIHPEEITEWLNTHPDVAESVSLGIPDEVFGERVVSCVALKPGRTPDDAELMTFLRQGLEEKKVPSVLYRFPELPKGISGKVQLDAVRKLIAEQGQVTTGASPAYRNLVWKAAAQAFNVPISTLRPDDTSRSIAGWDSMAHLDFIIRLEKAVGVQFDTAEIMSMNSLHGAEDLIRRKQSRG